MGRRFLLLLLLALSATLLHAILLPSVVGGGYSFVPLYAGSIEQVRLEPMYNREVPALPSPMAIYSREQIGFIDPADGTVLFRGEPAYGAAVTSWGFANFGKAPSNIVFQKPDGSPSFSLAEPGYPVARGDALLLLHANGHEVSEYDETGAEIWRLGAVSPITAVDAVADRRAVGFMSGDVYVTRLEEEQNDPAWVRLPLPLSEVPIVYNLAFDAEGDALVVRSGLDLQFISYFELPSELEGGMQSTWVSEVPTPSLNPGAISVESAGEVLVELSDELLVFDRSEGTLIDRRSATALAGAVTIPDNGVTVRILRREELREEFLLLSPRGRELYRAELPEPGLTVSAFGTVLVLAKGREVALVEVSRR